ncbi:hypothetical protein [Candidatus Nanohalovita haloferacivicina]|uniref:hypothetical protein n=1 Tax=Candidatus Nanohalovita haloferacivicina TaxID=2978046 RepID=UPI00325FA8E7|nr:hypothetical protein HBNXNv_0054 [Candidatus Nanohalobia archaeon BNXNv]
MIPKLLESLAGSISKGVPLLVILGYLPLKLALHLLGKEEHFNTWERLEKISLMLISGVLWGYLFSFASNSLNLEFDANIAFSLFIAALTGAFSTLIIVVGLIFVRLCNEVNYFERFESWVVDKLDF